MAIITETVTIGNKQFAHTYSDSGFMIHGGSPEGDYSEAYDPVGSGRTYTETDILFEATLLKQKSTILDHVKTQIMAMRDAAILPATKAIYDDILRLFDWTPGRNN